MFEGRASRIMLNGVSAARRTSPKPPEMMISRSFASPAGPPALRRPPETGTWAGRSWSSRHSRAVRRDLGSARRCRRHWLHDHPGAIWLERLADVGSGAGRIAQVVQTVKAGDEIEVRAGIVLGQAHLEAGVC